LPSLGRPARRRAAQPKAATWSDVAFPAPCRIKPRRRCFAAELGCPPLLAKMLPCKVRILIRRIAATSRPPDERRQSSSHGIASGRPAVAWTKGPWPSDQGTTRRFRREERPGDRSSASFGFFRSNWLGRLRTADSKREGGDKCHMRRANFSQSSTQVRFFRSLRTNAGEVATFFLGLSSTARNIARACGSRSRPDEEPRCMNRHRGLVSGEGLDDSRTSNSASCRSGIDSFR